MLKFRKYEKTEKNIPTGVKRTPPLSIQRVNGVYSRNNLPKVKDDAYVINLDEYKSIGTHWIALYVEAYNDAIYIF